MHGSVLQYYLKAKDDFSRVGKAQLKKIRMLSVARMATFLLIPGFLFLFKNSETALLWLPSFAMLIIFLILVKHYIETEKKYKKLLIKEELATGEIEALNHRFSHFQEGAEFQDITHPYSFDLDVFGKGSLFQYLNRTTTAGGFQVLASWLAKLPAEPDLILHRQAAVAELAAKRDWRFEYLASGKMFEETKNQHDEVIAWSKTELPFRNEKLIAALIWVIPVSTLLSVLAAIWLGIWIQVYFFVFVQWVIQILFGKKIKEYFRFFGQKSQLIEKYSSLLGLISNEDFKSFWLTRLQNKTRVPSSANLLIARLQKLVKEFEFRQNILVGFVLNSLFLWDVRCILKLNQWHRKNRANLAEWLGAIGEMDAMISFATFADNNPQYVFPEIAGEPYQFSAKGLGHPLLNPNKRINNDFEVKGWSKVVIVTGANMAGKSTFLRAVGTNLILAANGMPVCASGLKFTPIAMATNMRTTDSLFDDESYFFAELKRLASILTRLENGEKIFVILDEILKGTNSIDKLNGSIKLIRRLIQLKSVALVATHDLKLSEMEADYPEDITNRCFEIKIIDDELVFDFKLSEGVTKTMNATFLMKKMGIIRNDE
jgi:hypothetical protein